MKKNYKKTTIALGVVGSLILVGIWFFWSMPMNTEIVPFQETLEWSKWESKLPEGTTKNDLYYHPNIEKRPGILLRTDSANNLLIKHSYGTGVYLFDHQTKLMSEISEEVWKKQIGEISYCRAELYAFNKDVKVFTESTLAQKNPSYDVKIRGEHFATRGRYAINALESPSHKKAAILTADGPIDSVGWFSIFGLGGGAPYVNGKRYVEIIDVGKPEFLQEPLALLNSESKEVFPLCWSGDGHYLVTYKSNYENFSIIETDENR